MKPSLVFFIWVLLSVFPLSAGTLVRFETVLGSFDIQLYDEQGPTRSTPLTVANFLSYVQSEAYTKTFFHRSVSQFVLQGGGFTIDNNLISAIPTQSPVLNEPGNTNIRGTLAMAKIGDDPDSATNQWFINLSDNSANLDSQNGGFTVFGHVLGNGMEVVDALAAVPAYDASANLGSVAFRELPLLNPVLTESNFLIISSIKVIPFAFTQTCQEAGGLTLTWDGAGDTPVELQRTTDLKAADWQTVASNLTGTTFTDPSPPPAGTPVYYRLKKL